MEGKTKSITFDKAAQDALPQHIKDKMKADREKATQKGDFLRGHEIYHDGKDWRYCDNHQKTVENWENRPCCACGKENTPEGHDGCLGTLPGVINACCGHGRIGEAYVQFEDKKIIEGPAAMQFIKRNVTERSLAEVGKATVRQKFQELKDEFAKEQGHEDWANFEHDEGWEFNTPVLDEMMQRTWTAALDGAIKKFEGQKEACETLRDRVYLDGVLAVLDSLKLTQKS